jgi:hypothetical protein
VSALIHGNEVRQIIYGTTVEKDAAVLPATGADSLFTVTGGRVIVTSLIGECTTVCTSTATTVSVGVDPTTGTASATGVATATAVTSAEVGTLVSLPSGAKGALVVGTGATAGGAVQAQGPAGYVVQPGDITITTSATNTGAFKWALTYIPLDDGATVTAA